jgi:hypothetical protein
MHRSRKEPKTLRNRSSNITCASKDRTGTPKAPKYEKLNTGPTKTSNRSEDNAQYYI